MNMLAAPTIPAYDEVDRLEQMLTVEFDEPDAYPYTTRHETGGVAVAEAPHPP